MAFLLRYARPALVSSVLGLGWLASCSEGDRASRESGSGAAANESETAESRLWLLEPNPAPPAEYVKQLQPYLDPALGGWTGEVLVDRSTPVLRELLELVLLDPAIDADRLGEFLAEELAASPLVPAELATVFEDERVRVIEGAPAPAVPLERPAFLKHARSLAAKLAGAANARIDFDVIAVDAPSPEAFELEVVTHARGSRPDEELALELEWRMGLTLAPRATRPLVRSIALARYREVHAPRLFFSDVTAGVFGKLEVFERELMLGVDDYYKRVDRRAGLDFLGGNGIAVGDANGDGLEDAYVCQGSGTPNRLFLHRPDGTVSDGTLAARVAWLGVSRSALFLDLDDDDDQDLAVAIGPDIMVGTNDGKGVFEWSSRLRGEGVEEIFSLSSADPDQDGDLDLYACRYIEAGLMGGVPTPYFDANGGAGNMYWRNEGGWQFTNATAEAGLDFNNEKYSLASIWEDFDRDGDVDLYVTNDFGRNTFYRNDRGYFREIAVEIGADDMAASMGATCADVDLDGDVDVYVSNMYSPEGLRVVGQPRFREGQPPEVVPYYRRHARGNTLLLARGDGTFEDASERAGVNAAGWSWGGIFVDFGNDGLEDLYVPNGFVSSRKELTDVSSFYWRQVLALSPPDEQPSETYANAWHTIEHLTMHQGHPWAGNERNTAFLNLGRARFADVSGISGADAMDDARAAAVCDWDADGKLDLLVKNRTAPRLRLFLDRASGTGHWLEVRLVGTRCNRDAIGARVVVELPGRTLSKTLYAGSGYLAQSSKRLHFGLGNETSAKSLTVFWPDGSRSRFEDVAGDARWRITQGTNAPERVEQASGPIAELSSPVLERGTGRVDRIVLIEKLPLTELRLPSYGGTTRRLVELAGSPLFVLFWSQESEESVAELRRLAAARAKLGPTGLRIVAISVDEARQQESAQALLAELSLEGDAGPASPELLQALDVILFEVRGNRIGVPLPAGLLLDGAAQLLLVYQGPIDLETFARDLRMATMMPSGKAANAGRLGGQWLEFPSRDYAKLAAQFASVGATDLAALYASLSAH